MQYSLFDLLMVGSVGLHGVVLGYMVGSVKLHGGVLHYIVKNVGLHGSVELLGGECWITWRYWLYGEVLSYGKHVYKVW